MDSSQPFSPRITAIASIIFFLPVIASFAVAPDALWPEYFALLFHLAAFMLVPGLRAPEWARIAGYGWLVLDVSTGVMLLNGVGAEIAIPLRLSGHIFAGMWVVAVSLGGSGLARFVGLPLGALMFGFTFVSPIFPLIALAPASILMVLWLAIVAWQNGGDAV